MNADPTGFGSTSLVTWPGKHQQHGSHYLDGNGVGAEGLYADQGVGFGGRGGGGGRRGIRSWSHA